MKESALNCLVQAQESDRLWPEIVIGEIRRLEAEGFDVKFLCTGDIAATQREADE